MYGNYHNKISHFDRKNNTKNVWNPGGTGILKSNLTKSKETKKLENFGSVLELQGEKIL